MDKQKEFRHLITEMQEELNQFIVDAHKEKNIKMEDYNELKGLFFMIKIAQLQLELNAIKEKI